MTDAEKAIIKEIDQVNNHAVLARRRATRLREQVRTDDEIVEACARKLRDLGETLRMMEKEKSNERKT